ncbi:MAG: hypothetical protein R3330_02945 [Saprospiraceae bacterium]|nr:hypothetical protein [Saprospiraceae bacterium]
MSTPADKITFVIPSKLPSWEELNQRVHQGSIRWSGDLRQMFINMTTQMFWKGAALAYQGDDTVLHSYNVTSVVHQGATTGAYRITLTQDTLVGQSLIGLMVPIAAVYAPDASNKAIFARYIPGAPAGSIDIQVVALIVSGSDVLETPYDLGNNDILYLGAWANYVNPDADPLPETAW